MLGQDNIYENKNDMPTIVVASYAKWSWDTDVGI